MRGEGTGRRGVDAAKTHSGVDAVKTHSGVDAAKTHSGVDAVKTHSGVDANERLTAANAVLLLLLLAAEGATVPSVRSLLDVHVLLGGVLIPMVAVKTATTTYRFIRYYRGDPSYVAKGPPPWLLRALGPVVVALTVLLFGSGVGLMFPLGGLHRSMLLAHKVSFVLWFAAMAVHVLGHLTGTARFGLPDWTRRRVPGAPTRRAVLLAALAAGVILGVLLLTRVGPYLHSGPRPSG